MHNKLNYKHLIDKALKLRQDTFNAFIEYGEAHLGGSFSMIEMLLALHEEVLTSEDKFILSKAHSSFPYCIYLRQNGFKPSMSTHLEIDPENNIHETHLEEDKAMLEIYREFLEIEMDSEEIIETAPWIIRLVFDKEKMMEKGIVMEDIYIKLMDYDNEKILFTFTDDNSKELIGRISFKIKKI